MKLNSETVTNIFNNCIVVGNTDKSVVNVSGIVCDYNFDKNLINDYKAEIIELLDELPDTFKERIGGGWTFLNMCLDRDENQWTGLHIVMEQLMCLGIAIGSVDYLLPRPLWSALPGGVPYIVVREQEKATA